ncbi:MAG: SpoIIIAH-like family protein [Oscillibacter sp.]|nr:SpoIIIAH-like family protein [Oscillibacter sp.]
MKNQWKRNAVVATVLLFVCAAVYLNWRYAGNVGSGAAPTGGQTQLAGQDQSGEDKSGDNSTTRVLGDATLVGGVPTPADRAAVDEEPAPVSSYFDTARLSRQQSRDNALSLLREASAQENVDQNALDDANRAIQTLAGYAMLEGQIENLVVAKGYADCVAFMGENSISVVVSAAEDGLQIEDVAKITDIVLSETEYSADQIHILEAE